jgi:hypothetical protein
METFTLVFVILLLAAAFLLTLTIRRDLLTKEMLEHDRRRENAHARIAAAQAHALHAAQTLHLARTTRADHTHDAPQPPPPQKPTPASPPS